MVCLGEHGRFGAMHSSDSASTGSLHSLPPTNRAALD